MSEMSEARRASGLLGSASLAALLTAVVVGLAVFIGFTLYDAPEPLPSGRPGINQVTEDEARAAVLVAASELSQRVLTYHYDSFEEDVEVAGARLTPAFRDEYDSAMAQVRANTEKNKISQVAVVVSAAIISATSDEAQVLVFINQATSSARTRADQMVRNRLVVDLVRSDDPDIDKRWAMAGVNALG